MGNDSVSFVGNYIGLMDILVGCALPGALRRRGLERTKFWQDAGPRPTQRTGEHSWIASAEPRAGNGASRQTAQVTRCAGFDRRSPWAA